MVVRVFIKMHTIRYDCNQAINYSKLLRGEYSYTNQFCIIPELMCAAVQPLTFVVCCRSQANDLALLIAQMQKDADQVEKDVLRAEELLAVVRTKQNL